MSFERNLLKQELGQLVKNRLFSIDSCEGITSSS